MSESGSATPDTQAAPSGQAIPASDTESDDGVLKPFDQTNGLVDGLDGDAITGDDDSDDLPLGDVFGAHLGGAGDSGEPDGRTALSEEGRP